MKKLRIFITFMVVLIVCPQSTVQAFECFGIDDANANVCSGHGICVGPDECLCEPGYFGSDCSEFECFGIVWYDPNACSGHGNCVGPDECACETGWTGMDCSILYQYQCYGIDSDDPNVCSGHGNCVDSDQCVCDEGWAGSNCERCYYRLMGDFNQDCVVNFLDLAYLASVWLVDCLADPGNPACLPPE